MLAPPRHSRAHVATRSTFAHAWSLSAAAVLVSITSLHGIALARGGHGGGGHGGGGYSGGRSGGHAGGNSGGHSGGGHPGGGHFGGGHVASGSFGGHYTATGSSLVFHGNPGSPRSSGHIQIGSVNSATAATARIGRPVPIGSNFARPWPGHDLRNRYPAGTRVFAHVSLGPRPIVTAQWGRGYWGWRGDGWLWIDSSWWASPEYPEWIWIGLEWVWDGTQWIQLSGYWVRANS